MAQPPHRETGFDPYAYDHWLDNRKGILQVNSSYKNSQIFTYVVKRFGHVKCKVDGNLVTHDSGV